MAESTRLVDLIQLKIDEFVTDRRSELGLIAQELDEVTSLASRYLSGGKKFRGLFCYWGWRSVAGTADAFDPLDDGSADLPAIVLAASALEMFHAAALVHDDIMDNSNTRRGAPSAHRQFEQAHRSAGWSGSATSFGTSAALLLGDLLLGWSDELFDRSSALLLFERGRVGRAEFVRMRSEVIAGQYLDILEENAWASYPESTALNRASRVIVYKAAKYTVEAPLAIGAALGGASDEQLSSLRAFAMPLGIAYQLRDDLLGVFGDPAVTGKPAGDDLREGKRTLLIALARKKLPRSTRSLIDELLGNPDLDDEQVAIISTTLTESGAVDELEHMIATNVKNAIAEIQDAPLTASARTQLCELARTITQRTA